MSNLTDGNLAVDVSDLKRCFRGKAALQGVNLKIPRGTIQGLVGLNGAGKTTLIRHLIGSLRAESGSVRVLGHDPVQEPEGVLKQIGYMTEEDSLPKWMRVGELIHFCRSVYRTWDDQYARELSEMFSLSKNTKLSGLSKGQRARVGLLVAIAHRPLLLILDEPSSGLDPIARSDILEAVIRTISDDGRTVLFSSHLLDEVDRVCDHIALLHNGRIIDALRPEDRDHRFSELTYLAAESWNPPNTETVDTQWQGCFGWRRSGKEWTTVLSGADHQSPPTFEDAKLIGQGPVSLQRWFEASVTHHPSSTVNHVQETNEAADG